MSKVKVTRLIIIICLLGCVHSQEAGSSFWEPTQTQIAQAEKVARIFASEELDLSRHQLAKMKVDPTGIKKNGRNIIWLQFYDPDYHQPLENIGKLEAVSGGFPTYFTVSVETGTWRIVNHYASME